MQAYSDSDFGAKDLQVLAQLDFHLVFTQGKFCCGIV